MSGTFHPFPRLPVELRTLVWGFAVEPRTVDVRAIEGKRGTRGLTRDWGNIRAVPDPFTPVPVPGIMHACRESRHQGLYERVPYTYTSPLDPPEERYAWINFEMDMIDLYQGFLDRLEHLKHRIRRLKFERCHSDEYWFHEESRNMIWFDNLEVCHVVARNALADWYMAWEDVHWSCTMENLKFIDRKTGQMVDGNELQRMMEVEYAEIVRMEEEAERVQQMNQR